MICLLSVPLILYVIYPPEVKDTPDAPAKARHVLPSGIQLAHLQLCRPFLTLPGAFSCCAATPAALPPA